MLVKNGQINKSVPVVGTRVALSAVSKPVISYMIQANAANTGTIYIGDSSVSSSSFGAALTGGNTISVEAPEMGQGGAYELDLKDVYIDASVAAEGVSVLYLYRV